MANIPLPSSHIVRRGVVGNFNDGREHTVQANGSAGDTFEMGVVPAGARFMDGGLTVDNAVAGTVDIGDGTDADRFQDGDNSAATARGVVRPDLELGQVLDPDNDTTIVATWLTAAPAADDVVTSWVTVTFDDFDDDTEAAVS